MKYLLLAFILCLSCCKCVHAPEKLKLQADKDGCIKNYPSDYGMAYGVEHITKCGFAANEQIEL
jgi:hypothetical protein